MEQREREDEIIRREPMFVWDETVFSIEELFDVDGHTVNPNLDIDTIKRPDVVLAFNVMDHAALPLLISGRVALLRKSRLTAIKISCDFVMADLQRLTDLCGEILGWSDWPRKYFPKAAAGASDNPEEAG